METDVFYGIAEKLGLYASHIFNPFPFADAASTSPKISMMHLIALIKKLTVKQ